VEPIFFTCFSAMVLVELWESDRRAPIEPPAVTPLAREVQLRVPSDT
jgi:hypothetical protein